MTLAVRRPRSVDEALDALRDATADTLVLAGGTDLMVELESGRTFPDRMIDVSGVDELLTIADEDGGVRIGARATCTDLLESALVRERADLLVHAARDFGAVQIRNRATLGGNLGTASPAADLNPVLWALGATVRLRSHRGVRDVPVDRFLTGYRTNARALDELIESVFVPARPGDERRGFRKVGTRRAQSISKVVAALAVRVDDGRVTALSAAAGSVADRTTPLTTLERLIGTTPAADDLRAAARASAQADVAPRTDVRSTADYRRAVLERIVRRMLADAVLGTA